MHNQGMLPINKFLLLFIHYSAESVDELLAAFKLINTDMCSLQSNLHLSVGHLPVLTILLYLQGVGDKEIGGEV